MALSDVLAPAAPVQAPRSAARARGRRLLTLGSLVALLALAAVLLVRSRWLQGEPAPRYRTVAIGRGPIAAKVTANGTLSALVTVSVGSQVSGRIESLQADFGSAVRRGQVIATLDPALFRAAAAQAQANHRAALAALTRARAQAENAARQAARAAALQAEGVMTSADHDTAEAAARVAAADVDVARANVAQTLAAREQAELNLRYTTILSPIDGVVLSRNVDVGQTVAATLQAPTLFTIARDLTHMQVDTSVPEADVGKIRASMPVSFSVDSYPGQVFTGTVRQLRDNAQTVQNVVTYDAVVDVDNSALLLKPGMTASVSFTYAQSPDALRVPNPALRFQPSPSLLAASAGREPARGERALWLLRGEAAERVLVQVGLSDGEWTELLTAEVHAGDRAIVEALSAGGER
jgi:HlyD family secretion protein